MNFMDINIHASFLPHNDPDAAVAFYRDTLGFEVRNDVGYGGPAASAPVLSALLPSMHSSIRSRATSAKHRASLSPAA